MNRIIRLLSSCFACTVNSPEPSARILSFRRMAAFFFSLFILAGASCTSPPDNGLPPGDRDNGGLVLPDGFEAVVVTDSIGPGRHLAVNDNGDIYIKFRNASEDGSIVALRDTTNDGRADIIEKFGHFDDVGRFHTEMKIHSGYLYLSTNLNVYRYKLTPGQLLPESEIETIVIDDHEHGNHSHIGKPLSFDNKGTMYVAFGAPSDACQEPDRTPSHPGQDPCPELEEHGGIWAFDESRPNQTQADGFKFSSGIRSIVGMDWNPVDEHLYLMQHGRDFLFRQWPEYYTRWDSALLPAEEFVKVTEGSNFGWPYCYYDQFQEKKLLNPEYGGDGRITGRCSEFDNPLIGFPGHFAPNDLKFYRGSQFPDHYKNGAFIAFHGSTIRNPYSQGGYFVAFVPFQDGVPSSEWEVFANGFSGVESIVNTSDSDHRPTGLAIGPDGSLYVSDSVDGKIWRIMYKGDRENFGEEQLERMAEEKLTANNIRTPHEADDDLEKGLSQGGETIYRTYCSACHQPDGQGLAGLFPPLAETDWVTGDKERLLSVIIRGLEEPIVVRGEEYHSLMPEHSYLTDEELAQVSTYIRQNLGNSAGPVTQREVSEIRQMLNSRN
ncbi:MAG: PQQ-dependent sugar dehydrogenase [Balneolaceae bacterium]